MGSRRWTRIGLALALLAPGGAAAFEGHVVRNSGGLWLAAESRDEVDAHFRAANTTGNGRLTWDQARDADWPQVMNHFSEIDAAGRGWVTLAQIHAFERERHARRRRR